MWVPWKSHAPGGDSRRFITLLAASFLTAFFSLFGPLVQPALAVDAIWVGTELRYDGNVYSPTTAPPDRAGTPNEFEWSVNTGGPTTASVLYFGDNPGASQEATLVEYDLIGGVYTPRGSPQTISVTRDLSVDDEGTAETRAGTTCNVKGLGWIICPLSNYMADGIDWVYGIVESFLEVQTITRSDSGVYQIWELIRTLANVCFILVFLVIVYSQLTGAGYSNYNIKDMIPRLVIGAILVNISFWVCALAVDASNLLGYSIQSIFVTVRENLTTTVDIAGDGIGWSVLTTAIISGGVWAGIAGFGAAAGGSGFSLSFLLLAALIPAAFAILVAFVILAARQALIVVLTMISPLAFVAFVLPGTQSLFDKWRKAFTTLLVFFPVFAMLFGGSQLAGTAIINSSVDAQDSLKLAIVLIGLATMVVPLVLTPLLIRFSSGLLGQIANMANSKSRGLVDRAQGWARDNADTHKARKMANVASDLKRRREGKDLGKFGALRGRGVGGYAYSMKQKQLEREKWKKHGEDMAAADSDRMWEQRMNDPQQPGRIRSRVGLQSPDQRLRQQHHELHHMHKQAAEDKSNTEAQSEEHWADYLQSTSGSRYRDLRRDTVMRKGRAKIADDDMTNADELALKSMIYASPRLRSQAERAAVNAKEAAAYQELFDSEAGETWINRQEASPGLRQMRSTTDLTKKRTDDIDKSMTASDQRTYDELVQQGSTPEYRRIKDAKIQTIVDSGHSELRSKLVDAEGKKVFRDEFKDGAPNAAALQDMTTQTVMYENEAAEVEAMVQDRAKTTWEQRSVSDASLQQLRMKRVKAADSQKNAELQWNKLIESARAKGAAADWVDASNVAIASDIQDAAVSISANEKAIENLKDAQQSYLLEQLNENAALRDIAGGGTKYGATKVRAKAQSGVTQMHLDNVKAMTSIYSNDGYKVDELYKAIHQQVLRDGEPADTVAMHAAIEHIMENIGNNWAVGKTIDSVTDKYTMSMETDDNGEPIYGADGEPVYYDSNAYREAKRNNTPLPPPLTKEEVSDRRDTIQMVVAGYRNSKNKLSWMSSTLQESLNRGISMVNPADEAAVGRPITTSEASMLSEMRASKYDAERIANMDPDELSRMTQALRDEKFRHLIPAEKLSKVTKAITQAQSSEILRDRIKPRERGIMNVLAQYLELGDAPNPPDDVRRETIENWYYEVTRQDENGKTYDVRVPYGTEGATKKWVDVAVPTEYNDKRQDDIKPSGTGLYGPGQRPHNAPDGSGS